jgi:hypothetical protein
MNSAKQHEKESSERDEINLNSNFSQDTQSPPLNAPKKTISLANFKFSFGNDFTIKNTSASESSNENSDSIKLFSHINNSSSNNINYAGNGASETVKLTPPFFSSLPPPITFSGTQTSSSTKPQTGRDSRGGASTKSIAFSSFKNKANALVAPVAKAAEAIKNYSVKINSTSSSAPSNATGSLFGNESPDLKINTQNNNQASSPAVDATAKDTTTKNDDTSQKQKSSSGNQPEKQYFQKETIQQNQIDESVQIQQIPYPIHIPIPFFTPMNINAMSQLEIFQAVKQASGLSFEEPLVAATSASNAGKRYNFNTFIRKFNYISN